MDKDIKTFYDGLTGAMNAIAQNAVQEYPAERAKLYATLAEESKSGTITTEQFYESILALVKQDNSKLAEYVEEHFGKLLKQFQEFELQKKELLIQMYQKEQQLEELQAKKVVTQAILDTLKARESRLKS